MPDGEKKPDESIATEIAAIPSEIFDLGSGKPSDVRSLAFIGAIIAGIAYYTTRKIPVQPFVQQTAAPVAEEKPAPRQTGYW